MEPEQDPSHEFIITGRPFRWREITHSNRRSIEVRSGDFLVRILVDALHPNVYLGPMVVLGTEFPPGSRAIDPPFIVSMPSRDRDRHNLIHNELVKSIVQRFSDAKRLQRRPLSSVFRANFGLPLTEWPESQEERAMREAAERDRAQKLAIIAEKDARITDRRCRFCGQPCPSYRRTCQHCGRNVRAS